MSSRLRCLLALVLIMAAAPVSAHRFDPALLDVHERGAGTFDLRLKLPSTEAGAFLLGDAELVPRLPPHCRWLEQFASGTDVPAHWRVDCGMQGLRGTTIGVAGLEGSRADVIVRITFEDGEVVTGALRSGADSLGVPGHTATAPGVAPPVRTVLSSYVRLGIEHILSGTDHLLFVLGLMLLVRSWRTLLKTISAFTVAHSLTLALAVLGVVHVPPAPVEASIALSIVLVAAELARTPGEHLTLARRLPWAVAFVFGLLHGLGFAGALAQTGLPADQIVLALVAFNIGVELGQLAFVLAMLAPVTLFTRVRWQPIRLVPAYGIGTVAMVWVLERVQRFWIA